MKIQALVINPDSTNDLQLIDNEADLAGLAATHTPHATLWFANNAQEFNSMATFLWWKLCPATEEQAKIVGRCIVTGFPDTTGRPLPLMSEVLDLYRRMEAALL